MPPCTASGLLAAYMRACWLAGWASLWLTIYVLPGHEHDERLLLSVKCLWWRLLIPAPFVAFV